MADSDDKTEAATAQRLGRARAEGNLALSRDLTSVASLAGGTLVLMLAGSSLARQVASEVLGFWAAPQGWDLIGRAPWRVAIAATVGGAAPVVLAALLGGCAIALLQTGFALRAPRVDWGRLSPLAGLGRLFSADHLMETLKALVKLAALVFALWQLMAAHLPTAAGAFSLGPAQLLEAIRRDVVALLLDLIAAQSAITVLDLLWVRFRHAGRLRMSRTEVKDEQRESDGDPRIKARLRQIRTARMRRRMLAAVPKATLVVTNPTHYAVAIVYQRGQGGAPRVIAKGVDEVAMRIRDVARAHRIPVMPRPALARALYTVELDAEIPAEQFQAVAELIAYVWGLQARSQPRVM